MPTEGFINFENKFILPFKNILDLPFNFCSNLFDVKKVCLEIYMSNNKFIEIVS